MGAGCAPGVVSGVCMYVHTICTHHTHARAHACMLCGAPAARGRRRVDKETQQARQQAALLGEEQPQRQRRRRQHAEHLEGG